MLAVGNQSQDHGCFSRGTILFHHKEFASRQIPCFVENDMGYLPPYFDHNWVLDDQPMSSSDSVSDKDDHRDSKPNCTKRHCEGHGIKPSLMLNEASDNEYYSVIASIAGRSIQLHVPMSWTLGFEDFDHCADSLDCVFRRPCKSDELCHNG
jgi:hypothetical protein